MKHSLTLLVIFLFITLKFRATMINNTNDLLNTIINRWQSIEINIVSITDIWNIILKTTSTASQFVKLSPHSCI